MQDSKHGFPVSRHSVQDVGTVVCSPDNTNMGSLGGGMDSLLSNRDGGGSKFNCSLISSGLGVLYHCGTILLRNLSGLYCSALLTHYFMVVLF